MVTVRTIILVILWVGLMAGAGSAVLENNAGSVLLIIGLFIIGWSLVGGYVRSVGSISSTPKQYHYKGKLTKREIAEMRRNHDHHNRQTAIAVGSDSFFDSYGYKRDAYTGEYLYMNSTNTPNPDAFLGAEDEVIHFDGGDVYRDENGDFWREI